ncbi:MAG: membrane integrity-associated transporter subunit PqiC [Acetobacteraceae bacterium]|nr:membrane integrity-associated transporter subunit PqiC [Acetobacteraceae bacterium]
MPVARRAAVLLGVAGLAACRSPEPTLYTILAVPGSVRRGAPRNIAVREVSIARYLDRLQIVRSAGEGRLDVAGNDWWAESLGAMLTRVTVENLAQRLPDSSVIASGGAITTQPDAVVEVNLQRLGLSSTTTLVMAAQLAISFREPRRRAVARTESITVPVSDPRTPAFVAAASTASAQLADAIAAALGG